MLGQPSNPMLAQVEQAVQSKVPAQLQPALQQVMKAGLTILYAPQTQQRLQQMIHKSANPAHDAGEGAARMVSELFKQSNSTMPKQLIVPSIMMFAFEYLDLVAKAGKVKITPQLIAQTTVACNTAAMQLMGITKQKIQQAKALAAQQKGAAPAANQPAIPQAAPAPSGIIGAAQQGA